MKCKQTSVTSFSELCVREICVGEIWKRLPENISKLLIWSGFSFYRPDTIFRLFSVNQPGAFRYYGFRYSIMDFEFCLFVELSIVFTTPETIDRKSVKKSNASETGRPEKATKQSFTPSQQSSSTLEEQQNKINRHKSMTHFHNHLNHHHHHLQYQNASHRIISDENLVFPEPSANLTNFYNHTELYSRVVAPPTNSRSSSSSSSSESTASYESSTAGMSASKCLDYKC